MMAGRTRGRTSAGRPVRGAAVRGGAVAPRPETARARPDECRVVTLTAPLPAWLWWRRRAALQ
jgi:hypothetical protein